MECSFFGPRADPPLLVKAAFSQLGIRCWSSVFCYLAHPSPAAAASIEMDSIQTWKADSLTPVQVHALLVKAARSPLGIRNARAGRTAAGCVAVRLARPQAQAGATAGAKIQLARGGTAGSEQSVNK